MKTRFCWVLALSLALGACGGEDFQFKNVGGPAGSAGQNIGGSGGNSGTENAGNSGSGSKAGSSGGSDLGGSGGDNPGGMGGQGGSPICSPGKAHCEGLSIETCDAEGTAWSTTQTCPFVCDAGSCIGICTPGSKQCDGKVPQVCNSKGQWSKGTTCSSVCSAGECVGSCTPNTKECSGKTVRTCNSQGTWENTEVCPFVCQAGACWGMCSPGDTQCSGNSVQTCNGNGQWQTGSACPFVCQAGSCTGVCTPGSKKCDGSGTKTCNANAQWASTVPCPGDVNANPTCSGNGVCGTTCKTGFEDCTNAPGCESNLNDPNTCGSCGNKCNSHGGTATCSAGTCGIVCDAQHADCTNGATDGCERNVTSDPWNCGGCGISCHGGTCTNGVCNEGITKVSDASDVTSLALGASEVYWTESSGDIEKASSAGGQTTLLASGESSPQAAVTDGTRVIWSNVGANIRAIPTGGGSATTIISGHGPLELTHDGSHLYWTDQTNYAPCFCSTVTRTDIWFASLGGGAPSIHNYEVNDSAWGSWPGLAVNSTHIFRARWMSTAATSDIFSHSKSNPTVALPYASLVESNSQVRASHLVTTPNGYPVWFTTLSLKGPSIVTQFPNVAASKVGSVVGHLVDLTADDSHAYIIRAGNSKLNAPRQIVRFPLSGGSGTVIADNQFDANHIEVDGTHVYWSTKGYKFDSLYPATPTVADNVIVRAPK